MENATPTPHNPYVGPRPFEPGETLYGRAHEVRELTSLLIAERVVLLYSPSGAGKTSLLQAALVPRLMQKRFEVLPIVRVNRQPPKDVTTNRYLYSLLDHLEEALPKEAQTPPAELAELSLAAYLERRRAAQTEPRRLVLILDQFEEIVTTDPTDQAAKEAFFAQLGAALHQRWLWVLVSLREDYVARLDPFLRPIPTRLNTRFRLELLGEASAREAIQEPARGAEVDFCDDAAQALVDNLRRVQVQAADGRMVEAAGLHVEPVQLQVVCRDLWSRLPAGFSRVEVSDVQRVGDVDTALAQYYAAEVQRIAETQGIPERLIRDWCGRQLITAGGVRGQVMRGAEGSQGLPDGVVQALVNAHLVRAEERRRVTWYELAHDRLVKPLIENNAAWREENLSLLQRQADLWEAQGRPAGLLLRDEALREAERWAEDTAAELTEVESAFLIRCQEAWGQSRRIRNLAIGATVAAAIAMLLAMLALGFSNRARRAEADAVEKANLAATAEADAIARRIDAETAQAEAERRALISLAQSLAVEAPLLIDRRGDSELAALLTLEAASVNRTQEGDIEPLIDRSLREIFTRPYFGRVLSGHNGGVYAVTYSPDGYILATGSDDGTVRLWDLTDPSQEPLVLPYETEINAVAFSPDGDLLATGSNDGAAWLWDLADPDREPLLLPHEAGVLSVAFSPDGSLLATGSHDGTAWLWDLTAPSQEPTALSRHGDSVTAVAFSPDGSLLVTGSFDGTAWLWSLADPSEEPLVLPREIGVWSAAFSPDGNMLATGGEDGITWLWDLSESNQEPVMLSDHRSAVRSVAFSPDGSWLATGSWDGTARLWDLTDPSQEPAVLPHGDWVLSVTFSPDGSQLATGSFDRMVRLWDLTDLHGSPFWLPHWNEVYSVAFSPDGALLATGSEGQIWLWDLVDPSREPAVLSHETWIHTVAFSPDGDLVATGSKDGTAQLWNLTDPSQEPLLLPHETGVLALAFSLDGGLLATGGDDGTVRLWDLTDLGKEPAILQHDFPVNFVVFISDQGRLATGGDDDTVWLWDLSDTSQEPVILSDQTGRSTAMAFSPDGGRLATGHFDGTARLWDLTDPSREPVGLSGHGSEVRSVAFSPDGGQLATGSFDRTTRLWNLADLSQQPTVLSGHEGGVNAVAFSPDGNLLATGSEDKMVRLWPTLESLFALTCQQVGRNLSQAEWDQYIGPDIPYQRSCANLPSGEGAPPDAPASIY